MENILWTVNCTDIAMFVAKAQAIHASAVAIRTDNDMLATVWAAIAAA